MKLEHRWSQRWPVRLNAVVLYRPLGLLRAKLLNISMEGALVDAGPVRLPVQSMVELTFSVDIAGKPQHYHMDAIVVHSRNGNCGLMFKNFNLEILRAFHDVLNAA